MKFSYYYNRVKSAEQKRTVLTVRFKNRRENVNKVVCEVPSETVNRKIRPYCVVAGNANKISIINEVATIS